MTRRWAFAALALLTGGCSLVGDGCAGLSEDEARTYAAKRLHDTFRPGRPHDMLGPYAASQLQAVRVERHDYGRGDQMTHIAVVFHAPSGQHVINARLFPDCEVEWRPQLKSGQS